MQSSACLHCGLDIPTRRSVAHGRDFCCAGCEFVYGVLESKGLKKYYELRNANPPACPIPASEPTDDYLFYDDPEFTASAADNGTRVRFYLEGMNCTACIWLLEKLPEVCADVAASRVNMSTSTIEVTRTPDGSFAKIARVLSQLGYRPHALRENETASALQISERRRDLIRIGITAFLTGNIMIMTVSLYGGAKGEMGSLFQWIAAALTLPVLTYGAWPFYRSAFSSLRARHLNLDVPIVVAVLVGVITSLLALVTGGTAIYFDSLAMLVFLLLSSRFVLKSIQIRNLQSTNIEDHLLTGTVQKENGAGLWVDASASALIRGDRIILKPGALVPVDGRIDAGSATINAAVLTGESANLRLGPGETIEAGCRFLSGDCILEVTAPPRETRLAAILRETERLAKTKSHFVHMADRTAHYFIGFVLASATAVMLYFLRENPAEGISRALALVIVTCPCVFGIAIPLSMAMAIRNAARRGIIVKSADAIENLWSAKKFYFDKTATLTTGSMAVVRSSYSQTADLDLVLGLESNQLHPVARCLTKFAIEEGAKPSAFQKVWNLAGGGVAGSTDGSICEVRPRELASSFHNDLKQRGLATSEFGLFRDGHLIADFEIGDQTRSESAGVLRWLRARGLQTQILSGDRNQVVESCARLLGFPPNQAQGRMTPEAKSQVLVAAGRGSVMIGDGANDAGAFAAASVGIAVAGSLDVSLRAADVYLTQPTLLAIPELIEIAQRTKHAIYRNLGFSAAFNVIAGTLAIFGFMTPLWAAVIMPVSSITVLMSAVFSARASESKVAKP
jgi:heavy metal translocating P-type ATPase